MARRRARSRWPSSAAPSPKIGRKLLDAQTVALGDQDVSPSDSLLGRLSGPGGKGLSASYGALVKKAFAPAFWDAPGYVVEIGASGPILKKGTPGPGRYSALEYNFSLYFGLAVQEYERRLISDESRFDAFMEGQDAALTPQERQGLAIFLTKGHCVNCHSGPELTGASTDNVKDEPIERIVTSDGRVAVHDTGQYNIGVRPTFEDIGLGGRGGPSNQPLSITRRHQEKVASVVAGLLSTNPYPRLGQRHSNGQ